LGHQQRPPRAPRSRQRPGGHGRVGGSETTSVWWPRCLCLVDQISSSCTVRVSSSSIVRMPPWPLEHRCHSDSTTPRFRTNPSVVRLSHSRRQIEPAWDPRRLALLQPPGTIEGMPRQRPVDAPTVVHRTARIALRTSPSQRRRCFDLLRSGGDVWACVLALNAIHRQRGTPLVVTYQELCRELATDGPAIFGELSSTGARSVLRRYSDSWMATAKRRRAGDSSAHYPRRKKALVPSRYYAGRFDLDGRRLRIPPPRLRRPWSSGSRETSPTRPPPSAR